MRTLLILCLAAAACTPTAGEIASSADRAATDQAKLNRKLAGYVAEAPQSCLSGIDRRTARTQYVGSTVLYRVGGGGRIIRNDMNGNCPLGRDPILVTRTPTGELCRGETAQLLDRGSRFPIGTCIYGDFVTYRKVR